MVQGFRLSVAIPVHNEESVLPELLRRLGNVLTTLGDGNHEMIFVDDGSIDRSLEILEVASKSDPRIVVLALSRNFGHQAAISAALDQAKGDAVVVMDGDLQDLPEVIPRFVEKHLQGFDVVYAKRIRRKEPWLLRLCYYLFYRAMAKLSDIRLPLDSGDFALMSRTVIEHLKSMPEHHRYLRGMRSWVGFSQVGVDVERGARHSGKSKYSLKRLLALAFDGLFAFSIVPIRAAAIIGASAISISLFYLLYALYAKLILRESPQGFTALIVVITFFSGILLFFLGVIGEYVGRIYEETKCRPQYIVRRRINCPETNEDGRKMS